MRSSSKIFLSRLDFGLWLIDISRQKYVDFYRSIALNLSKLRSNEVCSSLSPVSRIISFRFQAAAIESAEQTNVEEAKRIVNEISGRETSSLDQCDHRDVLLVEDNSREIIQSACRAIGSVKDNEFDVRFNPDLFQPYVNLNQTVMILS